MRGKEKEESQPQTAGPGGGYREGQDTEASGGHAYSTQVENIIALDFYKYQRGFV